MGPMPSNPPVIPLRLERTDLIALLRSTLRPLVEQAEAEGIELRVDALGSVPPLALDREKIGWVVTVLVGNAMRHIRRADAEAAGGSVIVHLTVDETRGAVVVSVHDDGPGIPRDVIPNLFERRSGRQHAVGLALLLVRDVVAAHSGTLEVETQHGEEEHGTSIDILLPLGSEGVRTPGTR